MEALLDRFIVLVALGIVHCELSHSHLLIFLLDPGQLHGPGELSFPIAPLDLDPWDLGGLIVQREWRNIDILLTAEVHRLAMIVKSKIDTPEHYDQLRRYHDLVRERYLGWRIVALYFTPAVRLSPTMPTCRLAIAPSAP